MTAGGPAPGSTVRRLVLGAQLRRLREACGMTRHDAGYAIRSSESKISRLELGRVGFKERDVADLLTLYGVSDERTRETMLGWARESNVPGWWHRFNDLLPHWFQTYLGLEDAAARIRTYEIQFVPGLLQTPDYARAVFEVGHPDADPDELERRVGVRLGRQRRLWGGEPLRLWTVIDETALRRTVGGAAVMREQLDHLLAMSLLPNVTIQVMPLAYGGHAAEGGAFSILRFPDPEVPDAVYLENLVGAVYLEKLDDLDRYLHVMEQLSVKSASPADTRELLVRLRRPPEDAEEPGTPLRAAGRRLRPADTARRGGDVRAAVRTPSGLRLLMADALGAGPSADRSAAAVLTAFRDAAPHEPDLAALARHLHGVLAPGEDAVRALLLSADDRDERLEMVSCGHSQPLSVRDGHVSRLGPIPVHPPLGLVDQAPGDPAYTTVPFRPGDRIFVHSNGVSEARDGNGTPYFFEERLAAHAGEDTDTMLDAVMAGLLAHVNGRLTDEAELLAIHFTP